VPVRAYGIVLLVEKIARAEIHLNAIETEHRRVIDNGLYAISKKDNPKKFLHVIRLEIKPIPFLLGMLAGEFAYCSRFGLDQLAWQLALTNLKGKRPRSQTSFPIRNPAPQPPKGFGDSVKDISPAAFAVIEALQPYRRGARFNEHPLWILNELCITDKHVTMPVNSLACRFNISGASIVSRREFQHATEVAVSLSDKFKIKLDPVNPEVILGEPLTGISSGFQVRIAELRTIYEFVRNEVVPKFAGFFK